MKKKIIAFTMIELLVVVSIISIISVTSINWFFNFLQNKELNLKANEVSLYIDSLDKKVKNHEIYDYNIIIDSSINNSFISYENIYDTNQNIILNYDSNNNSWTINLNWLTWELWNLIMYKDKKLFFSDNLLWSTSNTVFEKNYNYKIMSTLSWVTDITKLNTIDLIRFDKESTLLKLLKISSDLWTNDIWKLEIKNIWWKKEFYNSWSMLNKNEVYLYFENKWKENYLKLIK